MALVLVSGTLSVTHSHSNDVDNHGTCSLCATAHTVAQVTQAPAQVVTIQVYELLEHVVATARPRAVIVTRHFTRPPPAYVLA
jgi:uncharacterized protein (UPF0276 family)